MTENYLAEFDAAEPCDRFSLVCKWIKSDDARDFFRQLREQRPVLVTPECVFLSKFVDICDALQMPTIFTMALYKSKMGFTESDAGFMMAHDDALHERERALMKGFLNRDDLPRVRALIESVSRSILQNSQGQIELVNHYGRVVPAIMVREYFGLDGVELKTMLKWSYWSQYDAFHNQPFDLHSPEKLKYIEKQKQQCGLEMKSYLEGLLKRKLFMAKTVDRLTALWLKVSNLIRRLLGKEAKEVNDDIVQRLLRSSFAGTVDFSLERIGSNVGGLLVGTIETTSQAVAQVIHYLLQDEDLLVKAKLAASHYNSLGEFDDIVFEALRFKPVSPYLFRQVSQDYTIAKGTGREQTIPKGTNVLLLTQSAMFDDYAFSQPDAFKANRNEYHQFHFGFGAHDCIGKYIGMVMIPEMVRQVLLQDSLREISAMDFKGGVFPEDYQLAWNC